MTEIKRIIGKAIYKLCQEASITKFITAIRNKKYNMKNPTFLPAKAKEECVVRYKSGEAIKVLSKEYNVTERTIYRWYSKYDGTTESLDNGSHIPLTPHPNKMPDWEEELLIKILKRNPNITNRALSEELGTGRNPAALHRKREKLFGKRNILHKYDYSVIFNKEAVDEINKNDALQGSIPNGFFTINVLPDLYLRINPGNYPVCLTPYFSVAIKFQTLKDAQIMINNLTSNNMRWKPKVIEVKNGIPIY